MNPEVKLPSIITTFINKAQQGSHSPFNWKRTVQLFEGGHYGRKQPRTQTEVQGHSLVRSLVCLLALLACFARTLCFALRCAHSFARLLTSLTPSLVGQWIIRWQFILTHSAMFTNQRVQCLRNSGWNAYQTAGNFVLMNSVTNVISQDSPSSDEPKHIIQLDRSITVNEK